MDPVEKELGKPRSVTKMQRVEIRVAGCLDPKWDEWFEGLEIQRTIHGETIFSGRVGDQAALYGLIAKLRDLGIRLLAITFEEQNGGETPVMNVR